MRQVWLLMLLGVLFLMSCNEPNLLKEYFKDNSLKPVCDMKNGMKHGQCKEFYENGALRIIEHYQEDKLHGERRYYSEKGYLLELSTFKNGILNGPFEWYEDDGRVSLIGEYCGGKKKCGFWTFYSVDEVVHREVEFVLTYFENISSESERDDAFLPVSDADNDSIIQEWYNQTFVYDTLTGELIERKSEYFTIETSSDTVFLGEEVVFDIDVKYRMSPGIEIDSMKLLVVDYHDYYVNVFDSTKAEWTSLDESEFSYKYKPKKIGENQFKGVFELYVSDEQHGGLYKPFYLKKNIFVRE